MSGHCPLIFRQVDATVTRINTLFVMLGVMAYLLTGEWIILTLLVIDFLLRLYGFKPFSPIQRTSLAIQQKFSLKEQMEDAGAKRLAAFFGVGFMTALLGFHFAGIVWAVNITAAMYLFCAGLDLFFGFCLACKMYHLAKKIYPRGFA